MKTIAHLTDLHLDEPVPEGLSFDPDARWSRVIADLKTRQIDEIVFGGDIGASSAHPRFFSSLSELGKPFRLVPGNHDLSAQLRKYYGRSVAETELYDAAPISSEWQALYLDSSSAEIGDSQQRWLEAQLEQAGPVLIFSHYPVLAVDTAVDQAYPLKNRESLKTRLKAHPHAVLLVCGHYHMTDERIEGKLRQLITPALSFQCVKESRDTLALSSGQFGYRLLHFAGADFHSELITFNAGSGE